MAKTITAVLLLPGYDEGINVTIPARGHGTELLLKTCQEIKGAVDLVESVKAAPEVEYGMAAGNVTIMYCVHGGEPKKYKLQPNPTASKLLNRWNIHGPVLCIGPPASDKVDGDGDGDGVTSLTNAQLKAICATARATTPSNSPPAIQVGPYPAYDKTTGDSIRCEKCTAAAVLPVVMIKGMNLKLHFCQDCHPAISKG